MTPFNDRRIVAIEPVSRGFAYVVLEGGDHLIDWGATGTSARKGTNMVPRVIALVEQYEPDVIVIERVKTLHARRASQARRLLLKVIAIGEARKVPVEQVSWEEVWSCLGQPELTNRYGLATKVAREFPALLPDLPPPKKLWQSEDYRMRIFYAAAYLLTWLRKEEPARAG